MTRRRIRLGRLGESLAREHLERQGYRILAQNWRARTGEIDLIAEQGRTVVFVEVKTRTSHEYGGPEEAVTRTKQQKLIRTAWFYLKSVNRMEAPWRIDVVALDLDEQGKPIRLEHYPDAVDAF